MGKEAYSFFPLANNFVNYMMILSNALATVASRYMTVTLTNKEYDNANKYFNSILFSDIIISGILLIPIVIIIVFIDVFLNVPINLVATVRVLFSLTFASMLVTILTSAFDVATFVRNRLDLRSVKDLASNILRPVLFYVFFAFFEPTIVYVGVVTMITAVVNFGFQYGYTKMLLPEIRINIKKFDWKYVKEVIVSAVWNSLNSLGNMLLVSTTLLLINILYGADSGGEYAIVQTIPNFVNGVISTLTGVFYPLIMLKYAQKDIQGLVSEIKKSQCIVGLFSVSVIGVFIGLSKPFFDLWTPGQNSEQLVILSTITIIPHCIISCIWVLNNVIVAINKMRVPAFYLLGSGVVNIIVSVVACKLFDCGMVVVPLVSTLLQIIWVGVFMPVYVSKKLNLKWTTFYSGIVRGVMGCFLAWTIATAANSLFVPDSWVKLIGVGMCAGIIVLAINSVVILNKESRHYIICRFREKLGYKVKQ